MLETLISLCVGAFMPHFIQKFKRIGFQGRQAHLIVAIFLAFVYTGYQLFAPQPLKENVYAFITQASVTAVLVYECLLKKMYDKQK